VLKELPVRTQQQFQGMDRQALFEWTKSIKPQSNKTSDEHKVVNKPEF